MAQQGWIKLYRQICFSDIWHDKPFNRGAAWVDILLNCNHADGKTLIDGRFVPVKQGQWITSIVKLAERWGWSRNKTTEFLDALEGEGMLLRKSTRKHTTVTVVNYAFFQDLGATEEATEKQLKSNSKATEKQLKSINKNDKNDKNVKNEKNNKTIEGLYFENEDLNKAFIDFLEYRKSIKKPIKTERGILLNKEKLIELSGNDPQLAIKIINQTIAESWQGLFPLKEEKKNNGTNGSNGANKNNGTNGSDAEGYRIEDQWPGIDLSKIEIVDMPFL